MRLGPALSRFAFVCLLAFVGTASQASPVYTVEKETPTLTEISLFLYGDARHWPEIARVNRIEAPYRLQLGQKLKLSNRTQVSQAEGEAAQLRYWRAYFGLPLKPSSDPPTQVALQTVTPITVQVPEVQALKTSKVEQVSESEFIAVKKTESNTLVQQIFLPSPPTPEEAKSSDSVRGDGKATALVATAIMDSTGSTRFVVEEAKVDLPTPAVAENTKPSAVISSDEPSKTVVPPPVAPAPEKLAELTKLPEELSFDQAKTLLDQGEVDRAVQGFSEARRKTPGFLPAWIYELYCLKKLERKKELAAALDEFKKTHPQLLSLPALQSYQEYSRANP